MICFFAAKLFIIILILEGLYLFIFHRDKWRDVIIATLMIGGAAYLLSFIANMTIQDPRPFIAQGFTPLIHSSKDNGFPSDHTLLLATAAAILLTLDKRAGLIGLLGAVIVGFARVYVGVHHVLDIVGSIVIVGLAFAIYAISMQVMRKIRLFKP